jgi:hypothetical protein
MSLSDGYFKYSSRLERLQLDGKTEELLYSSVYSPPLGAEGSNNRLRGVLLACTIILLLFLFSMRL